MDKDIYCMDIDMDMDASMGTDTTRICPKYSALNNFLKRICSADWRFKGRQKHQRFYY